MPGNRVNVRLRVKPKPAPYTYTPPTPTLTPTRTRPATSGTSLAKLIAYLVIAFVLAILAFYATAVIVCAVLGLSFETGLSGANQPAIKIVLMWVVLLPLTAAICEFMLRRSQRSKIAILVILAAWCVIAAIAASYPITPNT